ncbi:unnamed protein product [Taenia asiatica]|uniref:Secreted protein n=1 Tax=Taenia asiatica TaxID=60517 RepID=A0A0R3VVV0_TAEAS|nr:unnamed protein product [Taenia asiatica]
MMHSDYHTGRLIMSRSLARFARSCALLLPLGSHDEAPCSGLSGMSADDLQSFDQSEPCR